MSEPLTPEEWDELKREVTAGTSDPVLVGYVVRLMAAYEELEYLANNLMTAVEQYEQETPKRSLVVPTQAEVKLMSRNFISDNPPR